MEAERRAGLAAVVATLLLASTLGGYLVYAQLTSEDDPSDGLGYRIENAVLNEGMTHYPGCLDIGTDHSTALYYFGKEGMVCSLRSSGDFVKIGKDQAADTFATSVDVADLVGDHGLQFQAKFNVGKGGTFYQVEASMDQYQTYVTYSYGNDGTTVIGHGDMFYDATDTIHLMVHVANGLMEFGINGIEDVQDMPTIAKWSPSFDEMGLGAGSQDPGLGKVYMKTFILGLGTEYRYYDGLHKTIVPDGKDFAFSLHMHADRAYLDHFYQMANLSSEYGIRGTYDAWYVANSKFYSMQDPEYTAGLHVLQDSGWDIGVHAVGLADLNRTQVIKGLNNMTDEFGPLRTWSDHGARLQDLWMSGTDPSSEYYVADLVEGIGAAWMHVNSVSHSTYNDLNRNGMSYQDPDDPGLPLFRVSKMQAWRMYSDPGREGDLERYLRSWAVERSVFVTHDYLPYFFYVKNQSGHLSILPDVEGMGFFPWSSLIPKSTFQGEGWRPLPEFEAFLNWTTGYDVWFSPVRDIYDRSRLVQQVTVQESEDQVVITNPTFSAIKGLTFFTQDRPDYFLEGLDGSVHARKGSVASWHFVLDIGPGETLVLTKAPEANDGPDVAGSQSAPSPSGSDELLARIDQFVHGHGAPAHNLYQHARM